MEITTVYSTELLELFAIVEIASFIYADGGAICKDVDYSVYVFMFTSNFIFFICTIPQPLFCTSRNHSNNSCIQLWSNRNVRLCHLFVFVWKSNRSVSWFAIVGQFISHWHLSCALQRPWNLGSLLKSFVESWILILL